MYSFYQPEWDTNPSDNVGEEYSEPRNIEGKQFEEFLDICFGYASSFSLSKAPWAFCVDKRLENGLAPYKIRTIISPKWFCYELLEDTVEISIYRAERETKPIVLKYYPDLFLCAQNYAVVESAQTLENLCFFTREKLFMGTVSHEYMCHVYPPDEAFEKKLPRFGRWVYKEDSIRDQIVLADYT